MRGLIELQVPQSLLLLTLLVGLKVVHQVFNLLDLRIGIGVDDLCKILHETEVRTHGVGKPSQLTEFGDESDLIARPSVFVDEQGLVWVLYLLVVLGLVVLAVAGLSALFVEAGLGTLGKVNTVDLVRLLVVLGDDSRTGESLLDSLVRILVAPLSILLRLIQQLEDCVRPYDLEADIDIQENTLLLHDQARVKARPHLNVVRIK